MMCCWGGNDALNGDAGNHWLAGLGDRIPVNAGAGNDVLLIDAQDLPTNIHAGTGIDIVQVIGNAGVTLNLAQAEVEVVYGGHGNVVFVGNAANETILDRGVWKSAA